MAKDQKPRLTREDLDARFTARLEQNRARREAKLTAEDVERHLRERKERRAANRAPRGRAQTISLGLGIVLLLGSGVVAATTSASTDNFKLTSLTNTQRIASAKGDLLAIPAANDQKAAQYAHDLEAQITQASTKGEKVASLQQEFATIPLRKDAKTPGNGAPSSALRDAIANRKLLAPYFVDRALLVEDGLAYAPGSVLPFASDKIDPRFPWYPGQDPAVSQWALTSVVATSTPGVLEATWLNQSAKGDLFAWATASYYVDPGAFGSLTVGQTTLASGGARTSTKGA